MKRTWSEGGFAEKLGPQFEFDNDICLYHRVDATFTLEDEYFLHTCGIIATCVIATSAHTDR